MKMYGWVAKDILPVNLYWVRLMHCPWYASVVLKVILML